MSVRPLAAGVDPLALARAYPERYPHFLDTALTGQAPARFSILFAFPGSTIAGSGATVLKRLQQLRPFDAMQGEAEPMKLPFLGGWFLYLGYEVARDIEPTWGHCTQDPEVELQETRHQAHGLLDALRR